MMVRVHSSTYTGVISRRQYTPRVEKCLGKKKRERIDWISANILKGDKRNETDTGLDETSNSRPQRIKKGDTAANREVIQSGQTGIMRLGQRTCTHIRNAAAGRNSLTDWLIGINIVQQTSAEESAIHPTSRGRSDKIDTSKLYDKKITSINN